MNSNVHLHGKLDFPVDIDAVADSIVAAQKENGEIPWCEGDKTDPWDHVEAAMGLSIGGYFDEARRAFEWSAKNQLEDGSWYAEYKDGVPVEKRRDANMSAYIAVGLFHHYLITGDVEFLKEMWKTVESAIDFALGLQAPGGEIHWAVLADGKVDPMALLTGSSSIYMSIKCALEIAKLLEIEKPGWKDGLDRLGDAIRHKPHNFNMTKSRYSMDWFYPILSGSLTGEEARKRVDKYWKKFVVEGQGIRCVSDEPWVTIAETSEFCLALSAMGNSTLSEIVFNWICDKRFDDGSYWCGFTFPNMVVWPEEKMSWTNAVVLMAADALYNLTPAAHLFSHDFWNQKTDEEGNSI